MFGLNTIVGKSYFKDAGEKLYVTSIFYSIQGEGPLRGRSAVFVRLAKCNLGCSWCFHGNTWITMSNGSRKRIKDIKIGDEVVSWNEDANRFESKKVSYVHPTRHVDEIIRLRTGKSNNPNELVYVTKEHPFLVKNKGWVKAGDLQEGDVLLHFSPSDRMTISEFIHNGDTVTSVEVIQKPTSFSGSDGKAWIRLAGGSKDIEVYNFETEDNHTYVANGKIVHNCDAFFEDGDWLTIPEIIERAGKEIDKYFENLGRETPDWASNSENSCREIAFILTGGEPTLQKIKDLLNWASLEYKWTQIESNGILEPLVPDSTIVVVSPKCMEKVDVSEGFKRYIPTGYLNPNPKTLERASVLKFVMEDQPDFDSPYQTVPEWAHQWRRDTGRDVYVSPMNIYNREPKKAQEIRSGKNKASLEERSLYDEVVSFWEPGLFDMEANQRNHEHAGNYAIQHGFIFQMQLHLFCSKA